MTETVGVNSRSGLAPIPEISGDTVIWNNIDGLMAHSFDTGLDLLVAKKAGLGDPGEIVLSGQHYDVFGQTIVFAGEVQQAQPPPSQVPEPSTFAALAGLSAMGLVFMYRRRRKS